MKTHFPGLILSSLQTIETIIKGVFFAKDFMFVTMFAITLSYQAESLELESATVLVLPIVAVHSFTSPV